VLSVSVNWNPESLSRKFVEEYHLTFPVGYDGSGRISGLYHVEATPTSIFIAKDGKIVDRQEGALEEDYFDQRIQKLLAG
jgi:cytochrome c biogenesis protein CcmG, thiol:disulfide interchange protein DsbE